MGIGDFLSRIGGNFRDNIDAAPPEAWYSLAAALQGNDNLAQGLGQGIAGFGSELQAAKKRKGLASAFDAMAQSVPENMRPVFDAARQDPEMQRGLLSAMAGSLFKDKGEPTSDIQNYEYAVKQGFKGSYFDFKNQLALAGAGVAPVPIAGIGRVNPKTGEVMPGSAPVAPPAPNIGMPPTKGGPMPLPAGIKPDSPDAYFEPTMHPELGDGMMPPVRQPILKPEADLLTLGAAPQGQRWVRGDDGRPTLEDVPGFKPAQTQLPAEIGARIGLAEGFLKRYDEIEKKLPQLETVVGRGQVLFNTGAGAEVKRHIESGAEALIRSLTGAGKSREEAESYASRYLPSPLDTSFDLESKLQGLKYDLESSISGTLRDRGGWKSPASADVLEPPQKAIQYLRMNPKLKSDFDAKYGKGAADKYLKVAK